MRPLSRSLVLSLLLACVAQASDQDFVPQAVPDFGRASAAPLNPAAALVLPGSPAALPQPLVSAIQAPVLAPVPAAVSAAPAPAPTAGGKQRLIDTLSAAQPDLSNISRSGSAQDAERDFNERAQLGGAAESGAEPEDAGLYDANRIMAGLEASGRNWYFNTIKDDPKAVAELRSRVDGLTAGLADSLGEAVGIALAGRETRNLSVKTVYAHGSQLWGRKGNKASRDTDVLVVVSGEVRKPDGSWSSDLFSYKPGAKTSDGRDFDLLVISEGLLKQALAGHVDESFGMPIIQWQLFRGDGVLLGGPDVLAGEPAPGALLSDVSRVLWNAGKKMELLIFGSEMRGLSPNATRKVDGLEKIPPKLLGWLIEANLVMDRLEPLYGVESKPLPGIGRAADFWPRYFQTADPRTLFKQPLDSVVIQLDQATDRRFERLRDLKRKQDKPAKTKRSWRFW